MYNNREIMETICMIEEQNLDVRTITMGISLIDCMDTDIYKSCEKVYNKIYKYAKDLVKTGEAISKKYGIPIINKRVSVTPIAMLVGVSGGDPLLYAKTLDRVAKTLKTDLEKVMPIQDVITKGNSILNKVIIDLSKIDNITIKEVID